MLFLSDRFGSRIHFLIFLAFFCSSTFLFSENGWIPEGLVGSLKKYAAEQKCLNIHFETSVPVDVECLYPHLSGDGLFISYVNNRLEHCANDRCTGFVTSEKSSTEVLDNDFGGCFLEYNLYPVLVLPNLISVYGFDFRSRDSPHGCTYYEGKNFWQTGDRIVELELRDLFLEGSDWQEFLRQYCQNYLVQNKCGYYVMDEWYSPELNNEDLDIFILGEHGMMIVFRSYRVGGWADGPYTITIPYEKLMSYIDPAGPIEEIIAFVQ